MSKKEPVRISKLIRKVENRFLLSIGVAKRARQIKEGAKPLVEHDAESVVPVILALEEIAENKLTIIAESPIPETDSVLEEISAVVDAETKEKPEEKAPEDKKASAKGKKKSKSLAAG